jgi:hypothetical protein
MKAIEFSALQFSLLHGITINALAILVGKNQGENLGRDR